MWSCSHLSHPVVDICPLCSWARRSVSAKVFTVTILSSECSTFMFFHPNGLTLVVLVFFRTLHTVRFGSNQHDAGSSLPREENHQGWLNGDATAGLVSSAYVKLVRFSNSPTPEQTPLVFLAHSHIMMRKTQRHRGIGADSKRWGRKHFA